jgi:hypothetical protein
MGAYEYIPAIPGDADRDRDVDAEDLAVFIDCRSGPAVPNEEGCAQFDFDNDDDVDQDDFGVFQRCFSGDGIPADPDCAGMSPS